MEAVSARGAAQEMSRQHLVDIFVDAAAACPGRADAENFIESLSIHLGVNSGTAQKSLQLGGKKDRAVCLRVKEGLNP